MAEKAASRLPPPPASMSLKTRSPSTIRSVTRNEIERFWRRKKTEEAEHLLAAQKAAARLRSRAFSERDYKKFEEILLREISNVDVDDSEKKELQAGMKDWWTKSKYAYLNQPAIKSMEKNATPRRPTSTYIPHDICCFCSAAQRTEIITSSFGAF